MKKKFLIIFFTFNLISLLSCWEHCKDFEFYDSSGITVFAFNQYIVENDSLFIRVDLKDVEYFTNRKTKLNYGNNLYAQSSCEKGYGGPKYPFTRISITSDSDFNANFPANSELNELISVRGTNSDGEYVLGNLEDFIPSNINFGYMFLSERPEISNTHKITVEFEKSNGEIISGRTEQITWE